MARYNPTEVDSKYFSLSGESLTVYSPNSMNDLCVGGSFNPIHNAHLACALAAMRARRFERVRLIPSAQPPHKPGRADLAPAEDRFAMCHAAVADDARFVVDDIEIRRDGPSYTIDTVRELKRRGWPSVSWLIGADMLLSLPTWYEADALMREVRFVVVARPGWKLEWSQLPRAYQVLQSSVVEAPLMDISASAIRSRVKAGDPITSLVPAGVAKYIADHGLYR